MTRISLLCFLVAIGSPFLFPVTGGTEESATKASKKKVFAHYMPWFRMEPDEEGWTTWEHWKWFGKGPKHDPDDILENGRRDIASVFYPLIGPYNGRDEAVVEYHTLTAGAAGIEGFIADWYGPGDYSDQVFAQMVKTAERYGR